MSPIQGSPKLLLLHVPGADLQFIHPLSDAGALPNISALIDQGCMGNLHARPALRYPNSTMTLATGTLSHQHQIFHPVVADNSADKGVRVVQPSDIKTSQMWEMYQGRSAAVGWPASYPAPAHPDRLIISDVFSHAVGSDFDSWPFDPKTVSDPALQDVFEELRLHPSEVTGEMIAPFLEDVSGIHLQTDERIHEIMVALARLMTLHGAATWIAQNHPCDFLSINFDFVERITTMFQQYQAPRMGHVTKSDFARFKEVVSGAYRILDMMIGVYVELLGPDAHIILASSHGVAEAKDRRAKALNPKNHIAAHYTNRGVLIAKGPMIKSDSLVFGAASTDIAATCLAILGQLIPDHLDGQPIGEAFVTSSNVEKSKFDRTDQTPFEVIDPAIDVRRIFEWSSLGYVAQPDGNAEKNVEFWETKWLVSHADALIAKRQFVQALFLLENALAISPSHHTARLKLAQCAIAEKQFGQAQEALEDLRQTGLDTPFLSYLESNLLLAQDNLTEAEAALDALVEQIGSTSKHLRLLETAAAAYLRAKLPAKAFECFAKAHEAAPNSIVALNGMAEALMAQKDYAGAEVKFEASLKIYQNQPVVLAKLGASQYARKLDTEAEVSFSKSNALAPDLTIAIDGLKMVRKRRAKLTVHADRKRHEL